MVTRLELLEGPAGGPRERRLSHGRTVLGRGADADWSFVDPAVSRRHAAVYHLSDRDEIEDLGSTAGTFVNGSPVLGRYMLHGGDVVQLASVRLRYVEDDLSSGPPTHAVGGAAGATFEVDEQRAGVISNVGRDQHNQYNQYVQQVIVQREDAFRQIASMSRVARAFILTGFPLAVCGVLGFIGSIVVEGATSSPDLSSPEAFEASTQPAQLAGIPLFAIAMGVALVGMGLTFIGVIIQFAASTRKRDVDRRYPLPPGWG
ncbi:MAG TPA: FHA domain-containing protein [Ornithinibacter sp.]|nr:FHA domain-containing protein [Ornithinibacter sp.]